LLFCRMRSEGFSFWENQNPLPFKMKLWKKRNTFGNVLNIYICVFSIWNLKISHSHHGTSFTRGVWSFCFYIRTVQFLCLFHLFLVIVSVCISQMLRC
jgi:hypothetical protein